ncbi:MAG TPA: OstA-like protein [Bacteroidia bacterium]|nr:OstA-like protein [Bacteroidia bacterium]HNU33064.1 OstA-like protein [Bacteroidia bacterium]
MNFKNLFVFFFLLFSCYVGAQSPTKIELIHADFLEGNEEFGKDVRRLIGNVQFKHDSALMYCDSAYLFAITNSLDAFGHVRILQGDTISLTGDLLKYDGNTKTARMFDNIIFRDRKMTLTTQTLNYNLATEVAEYINGGKIVDEENVLVSSSGNYLSKEKKLLFRDSVVLTNPRYVMNTDTLHYFTLTKTAFFYGPCTITSTGKDSSVIYCENGWYNTTTEKSYFGKNAWLKSKEQKLWGDSLLYDRKNGIGRAFGNVNIKDSVQKVIISGDTGYYDELKQKSFVTGKTLLTQLLDDDSLFMHADTLFATNDTVSKNKTYFAYHSVKLFKSDLQGACDSLVYNSSDSTVRLFSLPILWSDKNQMTADSIYIQLANNKIDKLLLKDAAFMTSYEDSARYNQVKGKTMMGFFENNELYKIDVNGNGQSIYYGRNKKKQLTGVNRAECSNMEIFVKESKVSRIKMIEKPEATFYPIKELQPNELILKGFSWQEDRRPLRKEDIFLN